MEELGFTSLASDVGVFYYRDEGSFIVAIIYVDDTIFCGPSKSLILKLKEAFMTLGARGQLPSGSMLSTWRVLKQFTQLLPSG